MRNTIELISHATSSCISNMSLALGMLLLKTELPRTYSSQETLSSRVLGSSGQPSIVPAPPRGAVPAPARTDTDPRALPTASAHSASSVLSLCDSSNQLSIL